MLLRQKVYIQQYIIFNYLRAKKESRHREVLLLSLSGLTQHWVLIQACFMKPGPLEKPQSWSFICGSCSSTLLFISKKDTTVYSKVKLGWIQEDQTDCSSAFLFTLKSISCPDSLNLTFKSFIPAWHTEVYNLLVWNNIFTKMMSFKNYFSGFKFV